MSLLRAMTASAVALAAAWMLAPGSVSAVELTRFIEKDTISIMGEGVGPKEKWALVFSRKSGSISFWHDLAADPKMAVNLSGRGEGNGFALFQHRAEVRVDGKDVAIFPGPADEFLLKEFSNVRAIISIKGPYTTPSGEYPGEELARTGIRIPGHDMKANQRPRYETQFTIYPTGRIFIHHVMEVLGKPLDFRTNRLLLATAPAEKVSAFNDVVNPDLKFVSPASWIVHAGSDPLFSSNALLVMNVRRYPTDWLGQMMMFDSKRSGWTRSGFFINGARTLPAGKSAWNLMLQFEPSNLRLSETAALHAADYLQPGKLSFVRGKASGDVDDDQDEQLDGFAEGRGAYVVSADGKESAEFKLDCRDSVRWCPAFEVHAWRHDAPTAITVDGAKRVAGEHFIAHAEAGTLTLLYLGVFSPGEHTIRVDAASDAGAR
jgi:hypothetical protein